MSFKDIFSQQADLYVKYRPTYPKELYDFILSHLSKKEIAWDCATGSGQVASYISQYFTKVYASDISKEQLNYAPKKENIEYFNVPAEETGFPSNHFDLITVAQAIHWFDFDKFYKEVNRTSKNGGLLAVIGYGLIKVNKKLDPIFKKFDNYVFGRYFKINRKYLEEEFKTIPFPFEEMEAPKFKQTYKWSLEDLRGFFNSWSPVQKIKSIDGLNPVDDLMKEIEVEWKSDETREVVFPIFLRLGIINRIFKVEN